MSTPPDPPAPGDDPALDPGILDGPVREWNGWHAARRLGGDAVLPWRAWARSAGAMARAERPATALVRIGRGRSGTEADLSAAAQAAPLLAVTGPNDLGIAGWIKRLRAQLGEPVRRHARAHAAVAVFRSAPLPAPAGVAVPLLPDAAVPTITVAPGVFAGAGLDPGTALLLRELQRLEPAPAQVLDAGCGAGHLGLAAKSRFPLARVRLIDADARAVSCAAANAESLGVAVETVWSEAGMDPIGDGYDLILCNPPAHAGSSVDAGPGARVLRACAGALAPGGRLLVVANRRLPWEGVLAGLQTRSLHEDAGYKIIEARRG